MKLKNVLRQHDRFKAELPNVLGDAFLQKNNPLFKRTRMLAKKMGFRFVPAWENYRRASLFELQTILKKKTIPYNDSVPTLKRLARKHRLDDQMEDIPVNLVSSHFHESAHGISDVVFSKTRAKNKNEKILIALLCESYANATESMAIAFVEDETHKFFFEQNSYIYADANRVKQRRRAIKKWGATGLFRLLWLSYLYSNFLVENLTQAELDGVIRFALEKEHLSAEDRKVGTTLFGDAYELNENFRLKTAKLYMRLLGLQGDVTKNLSFDFSKAFLSRADFKEGFDQLASITTEDLF